MALERWTTGTMERSGDTRAPDLARYSIDPHAPVPIYHQIKGNIRALIEDGHLKAGQALPPERILAAAYGANRLTLRQAVGELVHEGVLRRQRGVGTFVAEPKVSLDMVGAAGFSDLIAAAGRGRSTRLISLQIVPARVRVARHLEIAENDQVWRLQRLRFADGEPFLIETVYLPYTRFPSLDEADFDHVSLFETLRRQAGCVPAESEDVLEPVILDEYERQLLDTGESTLGLLVEASTRDADGVVFEYSTSVVRGDRSRYVFHTHKLTEDVSAPAGSGPPTR
jgi:GntR family transcriptional regulator